jgi:hypothetical protein
MKKELDFERIKETDKPLVKLTKRNKEDAPNK